MKKTRARGRDGGHRHGCCFVQRRRAGIRRHRQDRLHHRPVGPACRHRRPGGAEAIKMAIEDAGGKVLGKPIELVTADHQNKADIAASKARKNG
ncbi:ABC transporter substrate-binding protein [Cupriavidus basilensis]